MPWTMVLRSKTSEVLKYEYYYTTDTEDGKNDVEHSDL